MEKTINWPKIKKIAGIVGNVILWIFVAFSVLMTVLVFTAQGSKDGIPTLFGKGLITIESPSMEPIYSEGDLVYVTKLDVKEKSSLEIDTIITYRVDLNGDGIEELNTHRIIGIDDYGFYITKGENNDLADNEGENAYTVHPQTVIGYCTEDGKIAGVGNVIKFLRSSLGFFLCIVLPLILFFLYELYNFISILLKERAKKNAESITKETEEEIKRRAIEEYLKSQAEASAGESAEETKSEE